MSGIYFFTDEENCTMYKFFMRFRKLFIVHMSKKIIPCVRFPYGLRKLYLVQIFQTVKKIILYKCKNYKRPIKIIPGIYAFS